MLFNGDTKFRGSILHDANRFYDWGVTGRDCIYYVYAVTPWLTNRATRLHNLATQVIAASDA